MRWLDSIIDLVDMNLSELEIVMDGEGAGTQACRRPPELEGLPRGPRPPDLCLDNSLDVDL